MIVVEFILEMLARFFVDFIFEWLICGFFRLIGKVLAMINRIIVSLFRSSKKKRFWRISLALPNLYNRSIAVFQSLICLFIVQPNRLGNSFFSLRDQRF